MAPSVRRVRMVFEWPNRAEAPTPSVGGQVPGEMLLPAMSFAEA
jgi:hypothetical protein